jgi:hypothetical protein
MVLISTRKLHVSACSGHPQVFDSFLAIRYESYIMMMMMMMMRSQHRHVVYAYYI